MSESGENYDPGPWTGWDFDAARKAHIDPTAGRGYTSTPSIYDPSTPSVHRTATVTIDEAVPTKLETSAVSPLGIIVDGTGSMGIFTEVIFKKLPLLDDGVDDYLEGAEISFSMIGDVMDPTPPFQIQPFSRGKEMVQAINKLVIGKGGGSNKTESYELAALYYINKVVAPKASKPILIYICDEGIYERVDPEWANKYAHVTTEGMTAEQLFDKLKAKYSVYCIRKHYNDEIDNDRMTGDNLLIHRQWVKLLGEDRVVVLSDPNRVVDVILGLLAHETDKMDFFKKEINDRQTPDQVKSVMKTMITVGRGPKSVHTGLSIAKRPDDGKTRNSKSLI